MPAHLNTYFAKVFVCDFQLNFVNPAKSSNSADLYNSVTDNMTNQTMFVIFSDIQAYPEYLFIFQ